MAVIFDLESTCSDKDKNFRKQSEIIEIGAVKDTGEEFQAFIKPKKNPILTDFCKNLTTIKQEDVDSAEDFSKVINKFWEFVNGDIVYSWGIYDKRMIQKECKRRKLPWFFRHINLKEEYAKIRGIKQVSMKKALEIENIKLDGIHHRGIDDARNILKIFERIKDVLYSHE